MRCSAHDTDNVRCGLFCSEGTATESAAGQTPTGQARSCGAPACMRLRHARQAPCASACQPWRLNQWHCAAEGPAATTWRLCGCCKSAHPADQATCCAARRLPAATAAKDGSLSQQLQAQPEAKQEPSDSRKPLQQHGKQGKHESKYAWRLLMRAQPCTCILGHIHMGSGSFTGG